MLNILYCALHCGYMHLRGRSQLLAYSNVSLKFLYTQLFMVSERNLWKVCAKHEIRFIMATCATLLVVMEDKKAVIVNFLST